MAPKKEKESNAGRAHEDQQKIKCSYCNKVMSGGIYRLKQHLLHVIRDAKGCEKVPTEV